MPDKPDKQARRAAREKVADYHDEQLAVLVTHVASAIDDHRAGKLDAFEVDDVIFQYSRAAKELWKFCNLGDVQIAAYTIAEYPPIDWWDQGAPRKRD